MSMAYDASPLSVAIPETASQELVRLAERSVDYHRMAKALDWLAERWSDHPSLDEAAQAVGLSPFHFQRIFTRWAGVLYFERIVVPRCFARAPDAAAVAEAEAELQPFTAVLEDALAGRRWLVGDAPTYADFRVSSVLPFAAQAGIALDAFPEVRAWHARLEEIEAWRDPFAGLD